MPTEFFYPDAVNAAPVTHDAWSANSGNKGAAVLPGGGRAGPMTHDDDSTYLSAGGGGVGPDNQEISVDFPGPVGVLTALTGSFRHRFVSGSSGNVRRALYWAINGTLGAELASVIDGTTSYADTTDTDALTGHRPGGGNVNSGDINSAAPNDLRFLLQRTANNNDDITRVTSLFGQITYLPPSGGFAFLLQLAGLSALPLVGRLTDIAQFRSYLSWRRRFHPRHTKMTPEEIVRAWDEIKAYRHPAFFLPRCA